MGNGSGEDQVRERVRQYYARLATEGGCGSSAGRSGCCLEHPVGLLEPVPGEASVPSLGCADPVSGAALQAGEVVLDLGSGGGLDCFLAARRVGPQGRVIGVDMTGAMVQQARRRARELGLDNVEFRQGLIEGLPLEAAAVDVVLSNCVINLSPDKKAVFREIARVLRPGGRVVLADIVARGRLAEPYRQAPDSWEACISGALAAEAYVEDLSEAGLVEVALRPADGRRLADIPEGVPFSALITARKPVGETRAAG